MPKLIAKVTIVTGKGEDLRPGSSFSVKTEGEAEHLVAIGAAEYPEAAPPPPPAMAAALPAEGGEDA